MGQETLWEFVWLAFDGFVGKVVLMLFALLSAGTIGITIDRISRYDGTHKDSRSFRQLVGATLRNHNLHELISIAQSNGGPSAVVIASGLVAFQRARLLSLHTSASEAAKRASTLSVRSVHFSLERGLNHLAAIIVTAPFLGVFGTCYGMLTAFKGCGSSKEACMAAILYEYSRALVPPALGVLVAVPAAWVHRYFESEVNSFDLEMESASIELVNYLAMKGATRP